jgi:hypothetical protein
MPVVSPVQGLRHPYSKMPHFAAALFVASIAMLPLPACAGELILHTVSVHFHPNHDQNNSNFGLSYLADTSCLGSERFKNNVIAGVFHNTRYNPTAYAGCYFNLVEYRMIEVGVMLALFTGYDHPVTPSGLLIGTYHVTGTWNLRVSLAPVSRGVATLSVGYRF